MIPRSRSSKRRSLQLGLVVALCAQSCSMTELADDGTIGPSGGVVTDPESGSWLLIPAGALARATKVSLTGGGSSPEGFSVTLGPDSTTLAKPATLTLRGSADVLSLEATTGGLLTPVVRRFSSGSEVPGGQTSEVVAVESARVACVDGGAPEADRDGSCRSEVVVRVDAFGTYSFERGLSIRPESAVGTTLDSFEGTGQLTDPLLPFGFAESAGYLYWCNGSKLQRIKLDTADEPRSVVETLLEVQSTNLRLLAVAGGFAYYFREASPQQNHVGRLSLDGGGLAEHDWATLTSYRDAYPPPPGIVAGSKLYLGRQRLDLTSGVLEDNPGALTDYYVEARGCVPSPDRRLSLCGQDEVTLTNAASPSRKAVLSEGQLSGLGSNDTHWFFFERFGTAPLARIPHGGGVPTVVHPLGGNNRDPMVAATDRHLFVWEHGSALSVVDLASQELRTTRHFLRRDPDGNVTSTLDSNWSNARDGWVAWAGSSGKYAFAVTYTSVNGGSTIELDFHVLRVDAELLRARQLEAP